MIIIEIVMGTGLVMHNITILLRHKNSSLLTFSIDYYYSISSVVLRPVPITISKVIITFPLLFENNVMHYFSITFWENVMHYSITHYFIFPLHFHYFSITLSLLFFMSKMYETCSLDQNQRLFSVQPIPMADFFQRWLFECISQNHDLETTQKRNSKVMAHLQKL